MSVSHTDWSFEGTYLKVSRVATYARSAPAASKTSHVVWSHGDDKGSLVTMQKGMSYLSSSSGAVAGGDGALLDAEAYLGKHNVRSTIEKAVNEVLAKMPEDPIGALAVALGAKLGPSASGNNKATTAPKTKQANVSEEEIKAQGEKVRAMKEALKANPAAYSKDQLDAEISKLKELKTAGGDGAEQDKDAKKDKKGKDKKDEASAASAGKEKGRGRDKEAKATGDAGPAAKMSITVEPVTGARDFYPEEMRIRNWLFGNFRDVARSFAFQEYDAPVLEHEELYKRKAGEEIVDQMYNFEDKAGFKVTLRPEMTPTLARMILAKTNVSGDTKMLLPVKWFSIPQCWRFENTQRGRKREHYQWNMDIVGVSSIAAEVELLAAIVTFFKNVGLTSQDVGIKVNSRKVMGGIMSAQGIRDDQFAAVCVVVDKLDKIGPDEVTKELLTIGVTEATARSIIKSMSARSVEELKQQSQGLSEAAQQSIQELQQLFSMAESYGFADFLIFDASVVRGLAYYTGVVFECFDRRGELRAICGGGRYDRLLSLYGSKQEVPCVGFGFGDCVIMELLEMRGLIPPLLRATDFLVAAFSADMLGPAMKVASILRGAGACVDMQGEPKKKVGQTFDYANRIGAYFVALVAPDEWGKGMVRIKNLRTENKDANQKDVLLDDLKGWKDLQWE